MKKVFCYFLFIAAIVAGFTSCEENEKDNTEQVIATNGCYIVNFGSYNHAGSSITRYDYDADVVYKNFNETQNAGRPFNSNIQFAGLYNNNFYFMGNTSDMVFSMNKYMVQPQDGVSANIEKPRNFVGSGIYLYISCWANDADWNIMPSSYIAKYNTVTRSVEKKIALPGGPEGLAISNGKLYAALNYRDSVAVINMTTETVSSYIATTSTCSYFLKDNSNNLYVSVVGKGLGYINTTTDVLAATYPIELLSGSYTEIMAANADFSKIYVCAGGWVNNGGSWSEVKPSIFVFDTNTKTSSLFLNDITGLNGVSVHPKNNDIYVLCTKGSSAAGNVKIYNASGTFKKEFEAGIAPAFAFYQD